MNARRLDRPAHPSTGRGSTLEFGATADKPWPRPKAAVSEPLERGDAFELAVAPHYAPLVRRLTLVLGDMAEAEDVTQEAYLQAFRSWSRFDGVDVRGWLYTIGLRLAFNELRRRRRRLLAIGRLRPRPWQDPADPDLAAALRSLEPRVRAVLLMNVVDGYTQPEIAVMLAVPVGTIASWISRARTRLRAAIE